MAQRELKNKKVTPQKTEIGGQSYFTFIAEDSNGIYQFATQPPEASEPEIQASSSYVLKYPIQVGTFWEDATETSLLMMKFPIIVRYIIESVDEVVTVPAGTFKGCVKIKGVGATKEKLDEFFGSVASINVEYYNWYVPEVGLIKSFMKEESDHLMVGSGSAVMQLESFKK